MKNIWKQYRIYIIILLYFLILGMIYFFVIRPLFQNINDKNNKIQEKITDQEIKIDKLAEIPNLKNQYDIVSKEQGKLDFSLSREKAVQLIERLEKISSETGNDISIGLVEEGVSNKTPAKSKKANEKEIKDIVSTLPGDNYIKMNVKISGNYSNFIDFLRKLENIEYNSDVISISINKNENSASSPSVNFSSGEDLINKEKVSIEEKDSISSVLVVVFYLENV